MTLIKSHSCIKCGGVLIVHNDKQQYECPYCNVFYDYEYFRSRTILEQADVSQKMLQYDSAKEKYEFILKKDPHNFQALRGKLLCEAGINRAEGLSNPEVVLKIQPDSLAEAEEMADEKSREYFYRLRVLKEIAGYVRANSQLRRDILSGRVRVSSNRTQALERNKGLLDKFTVNFQKLYAQLKELEPEEIRNEAPKKSSEEAVKLDNEKRVCLELSPSCTSCGGELIVNLNRQVYECPFCGLTFDFDIIRDETAFAEADEALLNKQFLKADAIYAYILAAAPSNFAALRGRILCAGKWVSLQDPMANPELCLQKAYVPAMKERIEEAVSACEDGDRPYFEDFSNSIPDFEAFVSNANPSNVHRRNKDRLSKQLEELEKEYEKVMTQYEALENMVPRDHNQLAEGLTPRQAQIMAKLHYRKGAIEREMKDLRPLIDESEDGVTELDQFGVYTIGNIRQHLANLIRFEWEKKDGTVDLSHFHDPEWEEE